jgi:hypothetical protein
MELPRFFFGGDEGVLQYYLSYWLPVLDEVPAEEKGETRADDKATIGLRIPFRDG